MDEKAIRGVPWTLLAFAGNRLVALATTIVLARILVPADFGLIALAAVPVGFVDLFSTAGLSSAIVMRPDWGRRQLGTSLTLLLAFGAAGAIALAALAPLLAVVVDDDRVTGVLAAMAAISFLGGFNAFYGAVLQREHEFARAFMARMVGTALYAATAIVLAELGAGVWSLVFGQLALYAGGGVALYALAPYRVAPAYDRLAAREVVGRGRGFVVQGGAAFLLDNADYLAIGTVLSSGRLGLYSMAFRLSVIPGAGIAEPVAKVTFPTFAAMHHRGEDLGRAALGTLRMVALVTFPLGLALSAAAEPLTQFVFGPRWTGMISVLAVLGVWAALDPIESTLGWLLNSVGRAGVLGKVMIAGVVVLLPALAVAASIGGIEAVAWGMVAYTALSTVVLACLVTRHVGIPVGSQALAIAPLLGAGALGWGVARLVVEATRDASAGVSLLLSVGAGVLAYLALVRLVEPGLLPQAARLARRAVSRAP